MLTYLLQLTLCWGLFALLYATLLQRETFFRANRAYLLGALFLGLLLPLADRLFPAFTGIATKWNAALPVVTVGWQQAEQLVRQSLWLEVLKWLYAGGAAIALLRLLWGLGRLTAMIVSSRKERLPDGCVLLRAASATLPFSFFHWIFVPEDIENQDDLKNMLAHERAHALGWHSVDVLLVEILVVLFWFHPLAHWYRRALRGVHEYLADAAASNQTSRKQYGLLLIRQSHPGLSLAFANHFFQAPLQQRLRMLTQQASPAMRAWKYALVAPAVLLLLAFTKQDSPFPAGEPAEIPGDLNQLEKLPVFPGGTPALMQYLREHLNYPEGARQARAEGLVVLQFVITRSGEVTHITHLPKGQIRRDMIDEAIRVVRLMPRWLPGSKNGQPVSCRFTLPIRFKLE